MVRGAPDDSNILSADTFYRLDDMAELAARLGSPVDYLRSGSIIYMSDFSTGLTSLTSITGGIGAEVRLSNTMSFHGGACVCLLYPAAAGIDATIGVQGFPVEGGKVGLAILMKCGNDQDYMLLDVFISRLDAKMRFHIKIYPATGKGEYLDSAGAYVEFADDLPLVGLAGFYIPVKLVVDLTALTYSRLVIGEVVYDLSSFVGQAFAPGGAFYMSVSLGAYADGTGIGTGYIDTLMVTRNEP